jgi:hypothetical protein
MAIRYTGSADLASVNISLLGDGRGTLVLIDLKKPPFVLDFLGFYPSDISVSVPMGEQPTAVQLLPDGILRIEYAAPLPQGDITSLAPRHKVSLQFVYG